MSGCDVRGMSCLGLLPSSRIAEVRLPASVLGTDMWSKRPPTNGEKLEHKQTDEQYNIQIMHVYLQVTFPESENTQRQRPPGDTRACDAGTRPVRHMGGRWVIRLARKNCDNTLEQSGGTSQPPKVEACRASRRRCEGVVASASRRRRCIYIFAR